MTPFVLSLLVVSAISFVAAATLTPAVARLAVTWGWMDRPDGRRKLHDHPVPPVGGVAVFSAFALAGTCLELSARARGASNPIFASLWGSLVVAGFLLMVIGLVDDGRGVKPLTKLAVQAVAASYLFYSGFRIETISNPFGGAIELGAFALPITLVWLVGMSNAINLIDGLDGLAAGLGLVSTLGLFTTALVSGRWETALVAGALAGALLGFLPYNFNPARVFLGDSGALPVGLILAAIAIKGSIKASAAIAVAVPLLALALPILDVMLAIVRRFVRRKPVFEGDHDHIHHRLVDMGLTPRRAVVTLYAVATLFTALGLAIAMGPERAAWAAAAIVLLIVGIGVRALGYWEVTEIQKTVLSRLVSNLRASGDAALRGLELDLAHTDNLGDAWHRVCATAWQLGFTQLYLQPKPAWKSAIPAILAHGPYRHDPVGDHELTPRAVATWSIEVLAAGSIVAEVTARRPLQIVDFDPRRFATVVQDLVGRHAAARHAQAQTAEDAVAEAEMAEAGLPGGRLRRLPRTGSRDGLADGVRQTLLRQ